MLDLFFFRIPPLPKNTRIITFDVATGRPRETALFQRQQTYAGPPAHVGERVIPCFTQDPMSLQAVLDPTR